MLSTRASAPIFQSAVIRLRTRVPGGLLNLINQPAVAVTSGVNLISSVLTGASGIYVARLLGPHDRGIYAAAMTWGAVLFTIVQVGVNQSVVHAAAKKPVSPERLLAAIVTISIFQSALFLAVAGLIVPKIAVFPPAVREALKLYCFYLPSWLLMIYLTCFSLGIGRISLFNIFKLLTALPPLLAVCWAAMGVASVNSVFRGLVMFGYLSLAASLALQLKYSIGPQWGNVFRDIPLLLRYGLRAFSSNLCSFANLRLDQLVLSTYVPLASLGMYSVATSYSLLMYPFSAAIANLVFPKMASSSHLERVAHFRRSQQSILLVMTVGMLVLGGFQVWLLPLLYGRQYRGMGSIVAILCAAAWCLGINYVLSDALRGLNRPGLVSLAEAVSVVITCVGLYVALPRLGTLGAAWVSLASYSVVTLILASAIPAALRVTETPISAKAA